jgi:hypothetical protein
MAETTKCFAEKVIETLIGRSPANGCWKASFGGFNHDKDHDT